MSLRQAIECKKQIKRAYNKALKEREYSKIEECIDKQRECRELLSNYESTH